MTETNLRAGHGYDVHRLVPGRKLFLGGVEIPFHLGLEGHSDGDVVLHALMDALLGATALGDIGKHFPPSDERWRGANSLSLLRDVGSLLCSQGFAVVNVDSTLIAEAPKIAPYVPQMRQRVAKALRVEIGHVSIKATTNEGVGPEGRGESMSAHAVALVEQRTRP